jgi:hypothetical protein
MVIACRHGGSSLQHVAVVIAAMSVVQFGTERAFAIEAPGENPVSDAPDDSHGPGEHGAADPMTKNQLLSFAFVMLACIIVGGAMLLALVVIWGNRTRRMAQSPLPPIAKRDELWFLKPKKEADDGAGIDAGSDGGQEIDPER